ncbi:MAG: serine hydrolase [Clostridia bacterium]|nr:serine hydrolase [Clostridia bacterium]
MPKYKRSLTLAAAAAILTCTAGIVCAEPEPETATAEETVPTVADAQIYTENPDATPPNTEHSEAALLMDLASGRLLYGKNITERLYPASTTKMMTGIIALESGRMDEIATASYEALQSITLEDSHMGILVGEELSMTDLVNGMLVYSANDAANVIAIQLAGSMQSFVDLMNAKAAEIGMTDTHFVNPCGVHDENHYTTANDLATLAKYCMQNEQFREIVKKPTYHIDPTNKYSLNRDLPATNLFLGTSRSSYYVYKQCTGIKTGTTEAAGHCLVASAEYNGLNLLTVVMKCDDEDQKTKAYSYNVSRNLFDYGFNNYETGILASVGNIVADSKVSEAKKDKRLTLTVDADVTALVPIGNDITGEVQPVINRPSELTAPIHKGDVVGTISYIYKDAEIGKANLIAANDVEQDMIKHILHVILRIVLSPLFFIPIILIVILAFIVRAAKQRKDRKRRLQQIKQRREAEESRKINRTDRIVRNTENRRTSGKGANSRYSDQNTDDND